MTRTKCWSAIHITSRMHWLGYDNYGNHFYFNPQNNVIIVLEHRLEVQPQWKLFELPPHVIAELAALKLEGSI